MKKNFFYFAMALCVALCTVSCGSDDDGDSTPHYTPQKYANDAAAYQLNTEAVTVGDEQVTISGMNFTQSGKAIFETQHVRGDKKTTKYSTYDVEIDGNTYTVKENGQKIGTVVRKETRAGGEDVELTINLSLTFNGIPANFFFTDPVNAIKLIKLMTKTDITRTWVIERMKLSLDFTDKEDASVETSSGSLVPFLNKAKEQNVKLSAKDEDALSREIVGITLDEYGLFTINYKDKFNDAAKWEWKVTDKSFKITMKDTEMGNKFLNDNVNIDVRYTANDKVALIVTAELPEDKCTAYITFNLK